MIGYVSLGTNDMQRASAFYDALLGEMGAKRTLNFDRFVIWGKSEAEPALAVCTPYDGKHATVGNGVMVALACAERAEVDRLHARARPRRDRRGRPRRARPGLLRGLLPRPRRQQAQLLQDRLSARRRAPRERGEAARRDMSLRAGPFPEGNAWRWCEGQVLARR
ncbi:hypothetical protein OV079_09705 [Nannocystis pusilla]|uniref:Glyoxalase/fosfomycin resistance/dioxygenase domain-containing protein n=1 Tax=Nannocystis pusilla TaxID=889268 RepID=A0A9X3ELF5_9BACT|nr:hypothetical protein [Nannocystis pusilla]MCY1005836.1 hypothetical protein [Nannocystis pusilla]